MSQSVQTTNGATSSASATQSHYTLVSHNNPKSSLLSTEPLTPNTAATTDTTTDDAALTLSLHSSVPSSPVTSKINDSRPLETEVLTLGQSVPKSADSKVATPSVETSSDPPVVMVAEMSEDQSPKPSSKRAREEDGVGEGPPLKFKKPLREEDVMAVQGGPTETDAHNEVDVRIDGDVVVVDVGVYSADELAESEKSTRKPKPKSKATPKKKAAPSRRGPPACAECKRRKVKCKHNQVENGSAGESKPATCSILDNVAETKENSTRTTDATETETVAQIEYAHNDDGTYEEKSPKKSKSRKKPAPKPTTTPPERTSTRSRKAPERFEDLQETPATRALPPKKGASRVFDPIYITTNSTSRLGRADIYHLLLEDGAWTNLSAEQQMTLISMLPDSAENQRLLEEIKAGGTGKETRPQWLTASDAFRDEVAKFKDDLTNGHLAKTWQAAAEQAVVERAAGEYDAWKAEEAELWWGQKGK